MEHSRDGVRVIRRDAPALYLHTHRLGVSYGLPWRLAKPLKGPQWNLQGVTRDCDAERERASRGVCDVISLHRETSHPSRQGLAFSCRREGRVGGTKGPASAGVVVVVVKVLADGRGKAIRRRYKK